MARHGKAWQGMDNFKTTLLYINKSWRRMARQGPVRHGWAGQGSAWNTPSEMEGFFLSINCCKFATWVVRDAAK